MIYAGIHSTPEVNSCSTMSTYGGVGLVSATYRGHGSKQTSCTTAMEATRKLWVPSQPDIRVQRCPLPSIGYPQSCMKFCVDANYSRPCNHYPVHYYVNYTLFHESVPLVADSFGVIPCWWRRPLSCVNDAFSCAIFRLNPAATSRLPKQREQVQT